MTHVHQVPLPPDARRLGSLPRVDYADAFIVEDRNAHGRTGEQWARLTLEGAPARTRAALRSGWEALGLDLAPEDSRRHVLGWAVAPGPRDSVLLSIRATIGISAQLLFRPASATMLFATLMHHHDARAAAIWAPVVRRHQLIVRRLLEGAVTNGLRR